MKFGSLKTTNKIGKPWKGQLKQKKVQINYEDKVVETVDQQETTNVDNLKTNCRQISQKPKTI